MSASNHCHHWDAGVLLKALAMALAVLVPAAPAVAGRVEVPIYGGQVGGPVRVWVTLQIGDSAPIKAALDTGSVGLTVLRSAIPEGTELAEGPVSDAAFGSGDVLHGRVSRAAVALDGAAAADMPLLVVDSVGCVPQKPQCDAGKLAFADYRLMSEGAAGVGFQALLGIGLGNSTIGHPLTSIDVSRWIVDLPMRDDNHLGRLILDPTDAEVEGFQLFHSETAFVGPLGTLGGAFPGCITLQSSGERLCLPICFDTGATSLDLQSRDQRLFQRLQSAGKFSLEFGQGANRLAFDLALPPIFFQLDPPGEDRRSPRQALFAGLHPYLRYKVLYDYTNDQVGLKPH